MIPAELKPLRAEIEKRTSVVIHGARRPKVSICEHDGAWVAYVDFFMPALESGNVLDVKFDSGEFADSDPRAACEKMLAALPDVYAESRRSKLAVIETRLRREAAELREMATAKDLLADAANLARNS